MTGACCQRGTMRLAIYDLDRTLTRKPTFTPFLIFAARRIAPWRLAFVPVWVLAMIGYRIGLYDRTRLKRFGMHLMTGRVSLKQLAETGETFASSRIAGSGLMPGAMRLLEEDRADGARIVIATAAFGFYARAFAALLGIRDVIATNWDGEGIPGGNCYGEEKYARVLSWLSEQGLTRDSLDIRFVSDSFADTPLLDYSDEAIFATTSLKQADRARAHGWKAMDLSA